MFPSTRKVTLNRTKLKDTTCPTMVPPRRLKTQQNLSGVGRDRTFYIMEPSNGPQQAEETARCTPGLCKNRGRSSGEPGAFQGTSAELLPGRRGRISGEYIRSRFDTPRNICRLGARVSVGANHANVKCRPTLNLFFFFFFLPEFKLANRLKLKARPEWRGSSWRGFVTQYRDNKGRQKKKLFNFVVCIRLMEFILNVWNNFWGMT